MKRKLLSALFLSTLVVTGCNEKNPTPDKPNYAKLFSLTSPEGEVCLANAKVKEYTDAIYAQRELAGVTADAEDKIVDPLYAETVKVADYKGDYDDCKSVELSFTVDDSIKDETFKVKYWVEGKEENAKEVDAVNGKVTLDNLFRSSTYEWCVISSTGKESNNDTFTTGDYIRFINCGGAFNVRDNGGWTTLDGKRIKQGLVYRGGELNDHKLSNGHAQNIFGDEDSAKDIFVNDMGVRVEIDLRSDSEADNITGCAMNKAGVTETDDNFVGYFRKPISSYHTALNKAEDQATFKTIFENYLANADEKPVYYHCYGGADRTGTIGFLLGAILGMNYTDLIIDYEATTFSNNLKEHDKDSDQWTHYPEMIAAIKEWSFYSDSKSLKEIIEEYLTTVCGVSSSSIAKIREIMLEDID